MKVKVPKGWNEVTLKQFYNLQEAVGMDFTDGLERITAYLSALTFIPISYWTEQASTIELRDAIGKLKFMNTISENPVKASVKINGRRFHVDLILRDSIASTFIDLATLCKDKEQLKLKYHEVLAVFFYEVNVFGFRKKRTVNSQKEIAEFLKDHCTMDLAFSYAGFFLSSYQRLLKGTKDYLDKEIMKQSKRVQKELSRLS